jgi:SAM-dependent methyltransferase
MTRPHTLTDRTALALHRARAQRSALFLHETARDEAQDRLSLVNRTFNDVAIVTPFPEIWRPDHPNAAIIPDGEVLDLRPQTLDLVIHAMALHWADDPVGQIIQCRRALKPDGLLLMMTLGGQTLHELRAVLAQAETQISGGLSPRIAPMAELRDMGGLLQRGGLALPVADSVPLNVSYADAMSLMKDLRAMGENNALAGRLRCPSKRGVFEHASQLYAHHFSTPDGRITATFDIICLTGWAPDDSQPKPLRPGSATSSLANALNTTETKLPD